MASRQVGGALGLAIVTTLSITHTTNELTHGATQLQALDEIYAKMLELAEK